MPIRPENRDRYPPNWREISARIRFERAGGRCECVGQCGLDHGDEGGRCSARHGQAHPRTGSLVVLTTAHFHGSPPEQCGDEDLFAGCQQCHNRYDAPERAKGIKARREEAAEAERARVRDVAGRLAFETAIFGPATT